MLQTCIFRSTSPPGPCGKVISGYHSFLENGNPTPSRMLKSPPARGRLKFRLRLSKDENFRSSLNLYLDLSLYLQAYSPMRTSNPRSLQSSNVQWKAAMTIPRNNTLRPVAQPRCAIGSAELFITARIPSNT